MIRLVRILFYISLMSLAGGCGESFKGALQFDSSGSEEEVSERFERPENITEAHPDHRIYMTYAEEMVGDEEDLRELHDSIEALDLRVTRLEDAERVQIDARLALGCGEGELFEARIDSNILRDTSQFNALSLGESGEYEAELRCTTLRCNEMIVALRKIEGENQATILVPLEIVDAENPEVYYGLRDLDLLPYFAEFNYDTVTEFQRDQSCTAVSLPGTDSSSESRWDRLRDDFLQNAREEAVSRALDFLGL